MINTLPKSLIEAATKILLEHAASNEDTSADDIRKFQEKWKDAGLKNYLRYSGGNIALDTMFVPKHAQNKGIGSAYMRDLHNLADRLGKTVTTTPSTDWGASKTRLLKFYKGHGYIENKGRSKDYSISDTMYRTPQKYSGEPEHIPEKIEPEEEKRLPSVKDTTVPLESKSPEFHNWFAGSEIKDHRGNPVVVYHGTPNITDIEKSGGFRHSKDGIFFTNDQKTAATYADETRAFDYMNAKAGIIPAHLNIKNPYIHDHQGKEWFGTDKVIADAREKGHDGVVIKNVIDRYQSNRVKKLAPSTVYVAFDPKQIKHATQNSGKHSDTENIYD